MTTISSCSPDRRVGKVRYLKPGVDVVKYKKLMIDPVIFFFAGDYEYKGIDPTEMKQLADQSKYVEPEPSIA